MSFVTGVLSSPMQPLHGQIQTSASERFALTEIGSFGWSEMMDRPDLTAADRKAMAGVLGRIADIQVSRSGSELYVLDADFSKIAVFDSTGRFSRVIMGGRGQGPGEFQRPRSMTFIRGDTLVVLDAGVLELPMDHTGPMIAGWSGSDFLVISTDPYPRIVRYNFQVRR